MASAILANLRVEPRRRPRALLAEDDPFLRRLIARTLIKDGVDVVEVDSGTALVAYVERLMAGEPSASVDVILTDVRMPGPSGLDAMELLRRTDGAIPILILTAFSDAQTRGMAARLGATLLDKPFDIADLRTLTWTCLTACDPGA